MEKDEEFTNSSSHYDFGARIYDGRIGRWLAVDQMMSDYPMDSPFIFGGNSPIFMVDIKGYYKFKFYTRKFAPFESFGGGFEGDDRGFSSNPKQSARVTSYFSLDAETGDFDSYGYSSKSSHPAMPWSNKYQDPIVAFPRIDEGSVEEYNSGWFNVTTYVASGMPLLPSPAIDISTSFDILENKENSTLTIKGVVSGDAFPSTEGIVQDESGQTLFLGAEPFAPGTSPYNALWDGEWFKPPWEDNVENVDLFEVDITIHLDDDGNFTGVTNNLTNEFFFLDEWNETFENKSATPLEANE